MSHFQEIDLLKDGQTHSLVVAWQTRLTESREESLSLLFSKIEAVDPSSLSNKLTALEQQLEDTLQSTVALITEHNRSLLLPKGFFVGEAERQEAIEGAYRLLLMLEPRQKAFRRLYFAVQKLQEELHASDKDSRRADLHLFAAQQAGASVLPNAKEELERARVRLNAYRQERKELRVRLLTTEKRLEQLAVHLPRQFGRQLAVAADMEQEGVACNPYEVARLCAQLESALKTV